MLNRIYCIYSTSYILEKKELDNIVKDNKYSIYNALEDDLEDILDNANYVSLFNDINYIVVKNVSWFSSNKKNDNEELLLKYLESPNDSTVLILLLSDKMNGVKKVSKIVKEKYKYIEILDFNQKDLRIEINKYLKSNNIKMDYDSVTYLMNNMNNKYDLIIHELEKVELYGNKNPTFMDINNIVSRNVLDNNFKFIEAIMNKNIKEVFNYFDDFLLNKNSPIMLFSMLANEYRNIYFVKTMLNSRDRSEIMSLLNIKYSFQMDKLTNYSYSFKKEELENYLLEICDLDYKIKQGKISDKRALEMFLLKSCN